MSQHDYNIANATFPNVRSDLNNALGAVATNNAGNDAPSTTYANQWWFDSDGNTLYMRNKDNDAWVTILTIDATSDTVTSVEGASTLAGIDDQSSSNDDQITITDTAVIINEDSDDLDFRVESNGNANAIFVNGGTDSVTIGASGVVQTVAGVPLYSADSSIYIGQDVSGTDDTAQYNVAIGFTTLDAITTGDSNVAIGYNAMTANTTGGSNISIGKSSLGTNTTGSNNIAIGLDALLNPDTESHNLGVGNGALGGTIAGGEYNVAIGNYSLEDLTSGDNVVAVGYSAGTSITTGANSVFVGYDAGGDITTGEHNVFVGNAAGNGFDTESHNLGIGTDALGGPVAGGEYNVSIGNYSLDALTSGDGNVAVGYQAGTDLTTAERTVFLGYQAGQNVTTGAGSVLIGGNAGNAITTGNNTIAIGDQALVTATTTSGNIAIGVQAGYAVTGAENVLIGHQSGGNAALSGNTNTGVGTYTLFALTSGTNNTALGVDAGNAMTTGSNNIMIGHDAGTSNSVAQTTNESNRIILGDNNITDFYCADSSISSSDKRDKTDIEDFSHGLNFIEQLQPKTYKWDKRAWYCGNHPTVEEVLAVTPDGSKKKNKLNVGFMAQDVQAIEEALGYKTDDETNLIFHKNDAMQVSLKYERLIPILVNAVKELSAEIKALKGE